MNYPQSIITILFFFLLLFSSQAKAEAAAEVYRSAFENAYAQYPQVPKGVLEAVAFNNTRFRNIQSSTDIASCMGMPFYTGILGLVADGQGYFRENLRLIETLSDYPLAQIQSEPSVQIKAYAEAWTKINSQLPENWSNAKRIVHLYEFFSEIPMDSSGANNFALQSQVYVYLLFLKEKKQQQAFNFPNHNLDLEQIFGRNNLKILSAKAVQISPNSIQTNTGHTFQNTRMSSDYPPAIWNPTTCNFNSRSGVAVSAVTIHTTQGSYAGAISWFKNCSAQVSAHYVLRSVDGQVTQVVSEANRAWHVGSENSYTIGLEHEGYVADSSWYTAAMYNSSANLVKDIVADYSLNPHSTYRGTAQTELNSCYRIKGHTHFPNQTHTDPGRYWDWNFYHQLINTPLAVEATYTACSGVISDRTGSANNYGSLERYFYIIDPGTNGPLTLNFSDFEMENNYDFLYVYNGDNLQAPLLASLTGTQIPADITASSGKIALLFESDCLYNFRGWTATWTCAGCVGNISTQLDSIANANCDLPNNGGFLKVSGQGGQAPYTYTWSNGAQDSVLSGLSAGLYHLTVEDAQGCFNTVSYLIASDSTFNFNRIVENPKCFGENTGEVAYEITKGLAPFSYNWSNGANSFLEKNLAPGAYSVTISDARNCQQVDTFSIAEAASKLELEKITISYGNGQYKLSAANLSGGTAPYSYLWNTGETSKEISVDESGVYSLKVTDANGCRISSYVELDIPTSIAEFSAADFKVFPVPFKETLNIQGIDTKGMQLAIHNTLGQKIYANSEDLSHLQISTSHWASGVYFVYLLNEEGTKLLCRKLLKY